VKIAGINSNVHTRLGYPGNELITLPEVHMCVRSRYALRVEQIAFSDQNQTLEQMTFTPSAASRQVDLTGDLPAGAVEAWMEMKIGDSDYYRIVDVVNLAQLEALRREGRRSCAFHGDSLGNRYVTFAFNIDGNTTFRLWYDPHGLVSIANNDDSRVPESLNMLVELEASCDAIDKIISRLTRRVEAEDERKLLQLQIAGWQQLKTGFMTQVPAWEKQFEQWAYRSRGSQVSGNLPRKMKRGMFI